MVIWFFLYKSILKPGKRKFHQWSYFFFRMTVVWSWSWRLGTRSRSRPMTSSRRSAPPTPSGSTTRTLQRYYGVSKIPCKKIRTLCIAYLLLFGQNKWDAFYTVVTQHRMNIVHILLLQKSFISIKWYWHGEISIFFTRNLPSL